jgi:hypothetical protein
MQRNILFLSVFCILYFSSTGLAKTKHAPLPDQILQAKTVCLVNQTEFASLGDKAFDELTKWGRFKIVQKPEEARVAQWITVATWTCQATAPVAPKQPRLVTRISLRLTQRRELVSGRMSNNGEASSIPLVPRSPLSKS